MNGPIILNVIQIYPTTTKLFNDDLTRTGIIVLAVLLGGFLTWFSFSLRQYIREKQLEKLPAIMGDSKKMFEQVCNLLQLGISDRYVLKKMAWQMRLPQPTSILLSPNLLLQAADTWHASHRLGPTRQWGLWHLDAIAAKAFGRSLGELEGEILKKA
jgi:hypothetical protein